MFGFPFRTQKPLFGEKLQVIGFCPNHDLELSKRKPNMLYSFAEIPRKGSHMQIEGVTNTAWSCLELY